MLFHEIYVFAMISLNLHFESVEETNDDDNEVRDLLSQSLPKLLTEASESEETIDPSVIDALQFDSLTCPICMDVFVNPRILSCAHVFCRSCLLQVILESREPSHVVCCVCRQQTIIFDIKIFDMLARLMNEISELARQLIDARRLVIFDKFAEFAIP